MESGHPQFFFFYLHRYLRQVEVGLPEWEGGGREKGRRSIVGNR